MGPLRSHQSKQPRFGGTFFACVVALSICTTGCSSVAGGLTSGTSPSPGLGLTASDVTSLILTAAQAADPNTMVIAIVDRAGNILGVYRKPAAPTLAPGNFGAQGDANELAVSLARTAAFFSNDQAPLSSRTVRFISGVHFPPGVSGAPNGDLYGIENTNRGCTLSTNFLTGQGLNPSRSISGSNFGL